ncbi:hypothetical protein BX616_007011 [Lobosporangium transversale]|uniref:Rgp1-domain-containing protein n=1 Tax=Lobosporangium transversale TaxID=64571 RepID=A0A1Y2GXY2_9FUNG|nr:Rgp1-domain-containing protein [Lobosporangium transversale]KAF9915046.1 hypothetical protein BX616_007011 [Lobosporangium transversale]ORZ27137.1 Rgp1-domain-containing protein [Lobosporangium transversale]|eukprot:XP_021884884.1 Rgp1-domain-containing protein [Lobosporangium transversale]
MPISVKATFAQEGVFFAGEKLNCTITFTNSTSLTQLVSAPTGPPNSTLPSRPSSTFQRKLPVHHEEQEKQQQRSKDEANGYRDEQLMQTNTETKRDTTPLSSSASSALASSTNSSANTPPRTDTNIQNPLPVSQKVDPIPNNGNLLENGNRAHSRQDMPYQRPSTPASRALSQSRLSSDISHIDATQHGKHMSNNERLEKLQANSGKEEQEEHEQTIPAPPRDEDSPGPQIPTTSRQGQVPRDQLYSTNTPQSGSQNSASSPGLLGLAGFMYRSASFSTLASAFGLSGGETEQVYPNVEKKLPPLPPPDELDDGRRSPFTALLPVQIMSPEDKGQKTTKETGHPGSNFSSGQPTDSNIDSDQLARLGTPIGLGLDNKAKPGRSRAATNGSISGLKESMIELQVTDNADTHSVIDDGEYQTPRPSMDYSTRSSMQSARGPFQQQFESPKRRASLMSNYSTHSSPRGSSSHVPKKESLLWGSVQVIGQFMVDGSFIRQQGFESLKTKTMYRPTGSSGGGAIGGGTLGIVNPSDWRDKANANRLFPVFSTPPSILFVDLQLGPGESITYSYQIELPEDLPPSHRGKTIRFAYNLILGVQRGSVHIPAKSVQLPFRLYNNISEQGTRPVYDLMSPIILHKDTAISSVAGQGRVTEKSLEKPKLARKQFEDYVNELIRNIKPSGEECNPAQARELTRRESDAYKDEETVLSHTCLEKATILSRSTSPASYDICKNNVPVAKLSLIKTRFKLGETVYGIISFSLREIPTYQVSITLETVEAIEASYACRTPAQTAKLTKRVHAELHESCIDTMRTSFALCIPPTATPEFKTSTLTLKWYIRVEFITGPANQPRFKMTSVDERRSQYQAVDSLSTENFDCTVPIQVYPTSYETGALYSPTVAFSLS